MIPLQGSASGRADMVRVLAQGGPEMLDHLAEMLGYAKRPPVEAEKKPIPTTSIPVVSPQPIPAKKESAGQLSKIPFWRLEAREHWDSGVDEPSVEIKPFPQLSPIPIPEPPLLSSWRTLLPRLRPVLAQSTEVAAIDMNSITRRIGQGRLLVQLPHKKRLRWCKNLHIIEDRSTHLTPFWSDQDKVSARLGRLISRDSLQRTRYWQGYREEVVVDDVRKKSVIIPGSTTVLVLGDLGRLSDQPEEEGRYWQEIGRRFQTLGIRTIALTPCPTNRWSASLQRHWSLAAWERNIDKTTLEKSQLAERTERLLRLVSPAVRVEPGLLRDVRRLLDADQADAGTEADVWRHPTVVSPSCVAATLDAEEVKRLRKDFAQEPLPLRKAVLQVIRKWRAKVSQEVWISEMLTLDPESQSCLDQEELKTARAWVQQLGDRFSEPSGQHIPPGAVDWFGRNERWLSPENWTDPFIAHSLHRLWWHVHKKDPERRLPPGFDARSINAEGEPRRLWHLRHVGREVKAFSSPVGASELFVQGSPIGQIVSRNGLITLNDIEPFWPENQPPSWAKSWGRDEKGAWVVFTIDGVAQKMRWIPPGRFMMGSPETEKGRDPDEDPRHEVTFGQGFWMFDTACSQELWQVVMGNNPSRFKSSIKQPVEKVSWDDTKKFITKINQKLPGLELGLPSEAQWEYACRAGTTTPYSFGEEITPEQANFNSNKKQMVEVASLPSNPWGLFEMHGNVREWCEDEWHDSYDGAPNDGQARVSSGDVGVRRVVRGGSWLDFARNVRAAYRNRERPVERLFDLGFRCSRVPVSQASQAGATPADPASIRPAERRIAQGPTRLLNLQKQAKQATCDMPRRPQFQVRSDCENLTFARLTKPEWAKAIGRDRFGLWAAFTLENKGQKPVTQRLRWIPPGRFTMGSPIDEPGRLKAEGPQHEVTFRQGYWLFDTPCTQSLWQAVMGDNPSWFQSPSRPVEQVLFEDIKKFLTQINKQVPNLELTLPSEAQWEYACRAGSKTALYTGDIKILGEHDAPNLDPIAWYGGNSGEGFELDNGVDTANWKEKQYSSDKAGTHPVAQKVANDWGLYDMLGNVWEWCEDEWHDSYEGAPNEGQAWISSGGDVGVRRVGRGGSWYDNARYVRAECRYRGRPDERLYNLGFRCSRVHS